MKTNYVHKDTLTATDCVELNKNNELLISDNQALLKENQELREALEIKSYCKYANKCNEIYDCSREEYEDMANANMRLYVENQELKKQLENCYCNRTDCSGRIKDSKKYDSFIQVQETQQKEFIKYLEDTIKKEQKNLDDLCDIYKVPKENNSTYKFLCSFVHRIEKILQKYKEITQTKSDKSV